MTAHLTTSTVAGHEQALADDPTIDTVLVHPADQDHRWWRRSVIYQVYPRSFRDFDGDGVGDLAGVLAELEQIAELGVDALWLSPFYPSPQHDGGYDVADYCAVDPLYGTLADIDALLARAHELGLKVIIDLVPNHCSNEHPLFRAALAAEPDSPEREFFHFRDGKGTDGAEPPNNWQSHFGGSAWTRVVESSGRPGQWYLHLFDSAQPDFNWDSPAVQVEFERILRFWLDRGIDGFRVDVAHALVKNPDLPDWGGRADGASSPGYLNADAPMFGQKGVHAIFRRWREILDAYGDGTVADRILCAEASADPVSRVAQWVRPDEMHQTFNFFYLATPWDPRALRRVIEESLEAFDAVGAPTTWVLANHDVSRPVTRFGFQGARTASGQGVGPRDPQPDPVLGLRRARAAALTMLALPGGVYLYQGEELGLPDHTQLPDDVRTDPSFRRTGGAVVGRDGCRVPLPWTSSGVSLGFSDTGLSWLPQPAEWSAIARDVQSADPDSTLTLYRKALELRRRLGLGSGSLAWPTTSLGDDVVAFVNGATLVVANMGTEAVTLPCADVLLESEPDATSDGVLAPDCTAWLSMPR